MSIKQRFKAFYFGKKKATGTQAVMKTLTQFTSIIDDLNTALEDSNVEAHGQADRVRAARANLQRIEDTIDEGERFLTGLKSLLSK